MIKSNLLFSLTPSVSSCDSANSGAAMADSDPCCDDVRRGETKHSAGFCPASGILIENFNHRRSYPHIPRDMPTHRYMAQAGPTGT